MGEILAVVTDLFFQSRIASAARAAGRSVRFEHRLERLSTSTGWDVALVDLDAATDVPSAIAVLAASGRGQIVAFGPHLDTDRRKAARRAGAHRVLAKSKFVTELTHIMNDSSTAGAGDVADLAEYGRRMEELGRMFQDPAQVARIYFAPDPHMEQAETHGEPIILDAADYLPFLAVESLRPRLQRIRAFGGPTSE